MPRLLQKKNKWKCFFHPLFTKSYLHSSSLWKSLVIELWSKLHSGGWQVPPWPPHHLNSLLSPNFTNQAQLGRLVKVVAQFCSLSILMFKNNGPTLGHKVFLKRRNIMTTFSYFCMFLLIRYLNCKLPNSLSSSYEVSELCKCPSQAKIASTAQYART